MSDRRTTAIAAERDSARDRVTPRGQAPGPVDGCSGESGPTHGQPGYNPVGYPTGTVWPHDNALIAAGMKRAGRHDAADRVASRIFEAAQHSPDFRLPELFCGFDRGLADVPVPYPVACSPQAWAAATSLSLLQTMLGMHADAANDILELDRPHLPAWLGKSRCTTCGSASGRSTSCSTVGAGIPQAPRCCAETARSSS